MVYSFKRNQPSCCTISNHPAVINWKPQLRFSPLIIHVRSSSTETSSKIALGKLKKVGRLQEKQFKFLLPSSHSGSVDEWKRTNLTSPQNPNEPSELTIYYFIKFMIFMMIYNYFILHLSYVLNRSKILAACITKSWVKIKYSPFTMGDRSFKIEKTYFKSWKNQKRRCLKNGGSNFRISTIIHIEILKSIKGA